MLGKDLIMQTLLGGGSGGGSSGGGGIPQADIDAAFAALAEKGVTVPDGATSADLDDLIASIVTSGGGDFTTGTFTLAETTANYKFAEYEKTKYATGNPNFVALRRVDDLVSPGDYTFFFLASVYLPGKIHQVGLQNNPSKVLAEYKSASSSEGSWATTGSGISINSLSVSSKVGTLTATSFAYSLPSGTYAYIFGDLD